MKNFHEWLEQKYTDWEKKQPGKQTYYSFARYLDVGHSTLTLWITGAALPEPILAPQLAARLGPEVYDYLDQARPNSPLEQIQSGLPSLPLAFQTRLASAVSEAAGMISENQLNPESVDAKRLTVWVFEKWGFKISG